MTNEHRKRLREALKTQFAPMTSMWTSMTDEAYAAWREQMNDQIETIRLTIKMVDALRKGAGK